MVVVNKMAESAVSPVNGCGKGDRCVTGALTGNCSTGKVNSRSCVFADNVCQDEVTQELACKAKCLVLPAACWSSWRVCSVGIWSCC